MFQCGGVVHLASLVPSSLAILESYFYLPVLLPRVEVITIDDVVILALLLYNAYFYFHALLMTL